MELVAEAVELPKQFGVPSGVGGHALEVVQACERHGVKADFYIKTFHSHSYPTAPKPEQIKGPLSEIPGYWCSNPQETADFMKGVREAVDCVQDHGGGRDSASASLPSGVWKRRRLRAGWHVRLRDCRRRANRPRRGGYLSRPRAALAGLKPAHAKSTCVLCGPAGAFWRGQRPLGASGDGTPVAGSWRPWRSCQGEWPGTVGLALGMAFDRQECQRQRRVAVAADRIKNQFG